MTREELDEIRSDSKNDDNVVERLFDIINDIDSRLCENCIYKMKVHRPNGYCKLTQTSILFPSYGCTEFKRK